MSCEQSRRKENSYKKIGERLCVSSIALARILRIGRSARGREVLKRGEVSWFEPGYRSLAIPNFSVISPKCLVREILGAIWLRQPITTAFHTWHRLQYIQIGRAAQQEGRGR